MPFRVSLGSSFDFCTHLICFLLCSLVLKSSYVPFYFYHIIMIGLVVKLINEWKRRIHVDEHWNWCIGSYSRSQSFVIKKIYLVVVF